MPSSSQSSFLERFWNWYERYYRINLVLTAGLFCLQLIHLYWLTMAVVIFRLTGQPYFSLTTFYQTIIIAVDYTEIPALISTSLLYAFELRKGFRWRPVLYLIFLNTQWLHLFWITDEFVIAQFMGEAQAVMLPMWLAWVAIVIDYLELPVIVDTVYSACQFLLQGRFFRMLRERSRYHVWHI